MKFQRTPSQRFASRKNSILLSRATKAAAEVAAVTAAPTGNAKEVGEEDEDFSSLVTHLGGVRGVGGLIKPPCGPSMSVAAVAADTPGKDGGIDTKTLGSVYGVTTYILV